MSRLFYHVMQDNLGNLLFDVTGTMRLAGSGTLATIYGDEALTVVLPNPMTNHPSFGSFKCFLGAGDYDFYMAKGGYTFETLTGVQGHGTMAQQNANAVAITGGSATLSTLGTASMNDTGPAVITGPVRIGSQVFPGYPLDVTGHVRVNGQTILGADAPPTAGNVMNTVYFDKSAFYGMGFRQIVNDTGAGQPIQFYNAAGTSCGLISTTATTTAYATSSDARLKHTIEALTGALAVVCALTPVTHRWKADNSPGVGFLAHEVQEVVGGVVTGERDAVDADGQIIPQQIDYAKLVPWLVGAIKDLAQQVETLTARLAAQAIP